MSDAERALLGAALSGCCADLDEVLDAVAPSDFYAPFHEQVWVAIGQVHAAGLCPELVSVKDALDAAQVRYDPIKLAELVHAAPIAAQAPYYAERVVYDAGRRAIGVAGTRLQQVADANGEDLESLQERARQVVDEATRRRTVSRARTIAELVPEVIDAAEKGRTHVLGTGWPDLDHIIDGLAPGRLVVVGARPGIGKSIMGTNLALHFASRHDHAALVASLEMPEIEVGQRMLATWAGVDLTNLIHGRLSEREWERVAEKQQTLADLPITVDDSPGLSVAGIRRAARNVQRQRDDLALVVVDYLQLVRPVDTRVNRVEQVGEISRGLKLLARETGACVVAMAQLNRASIHNGTPRMSDLRESGAVEADADVVILLHQPDDDIPEVEVIVDKNRHGRKGRCTLMAAGYNAELRSVSTEGERRWWDR